MNIFCGPHAIYDFVKKLWLFDLLFNWERWTHYHCCQCKNNLGLRSYHIKLYKWSNRFIYYHYLSHTWSISSLILFIFPHVIQEFWVMKRGKKERNSHNLINKRSTSKIAIKYVINRLLHDLCHIITRISPQKLPYHMIWVFFWLIRLMIWQKPCNTIILSAVWVMC